MEASESFDKFVCSKEYIRIFNNLVHTCTFIYHYTSPAGLMGILQPNGNAKLWFTQYDCLNDISERTEIIEYINNFCNYKVKCEQMSAEFADAIKKLQLIDDCFLTLPGQPYNSEKLGYVEDVTMCTSVECDTYLCCFSEESDLLPMWNYYTKEQQCQGYSIGFLSDIIENGGGFEKGYFLEIKKVIYENKEKNDLLNSILEPFNKIYIEADAIVKKKIITQIYSFIHEYQFIFKNSTFSHEKEVRAILRIPKQPIKEGKTFERKFRISNGYIVPYVEYECPKDAVQEITIAPLLQPEIAKANLKCMTEQYKYENVLVYSSRIPIRF